MLFERDYIDLQRQAEGKRVRWGGGGRGGRGGGEGQGSTCTLPPLDCIDTVPSSPSTAMSPPCDVRLALPFMVSRMENAMELRPVLTCNDSV